MRVKLCHQGTIALLLVVVQLAACGSTPATRFYTLSSLTGSGDTAGTTAAVKPRKVIAIGPVTMAKYLDHPGITTRSGANTITRSELDRWGGSLGDEVSRVFVEDLRQLLPGGRYQVLPWMETVVMDYRVQFNITRFEMIPEGPIVLNAAWMLFGRERNVLLASGDAAVTEPVHGTGYAAISAAMSRALAELCRQVAVEIRN